MISDRQVQRSLRFARPVLAEHFDKITAQQILTDLEAAYPALAPGVPEFHSPINRMVLGIAVDTLAFYRVLPAQLSWDVKAIMLQEFVDNWVDGQFDRWIARVGYANRTMHLIYRRRWFNQANRANEPDGWQYELLPPTSGLFYGLNVTRCGAVPYLQAQGAPEIAPLICRGDYHVLKYLPQGVTFRRTQVIAEGDPICDFRYYLESGSAS